MNSFLPILREHWRQWQYNRHEKLKYYNFWQDERPKEMWFSRFIAHHFPNNHRRINFNSVLGPKELMSDGRPGINIFYTGENIHTSRFHNHYQRYTKQHYDLALGFDFQQHENYMRLPLWLMWCFPPEATQNDIVNLCNAMNHPQSVTRPRFCSLICSHDQDGIRGQIMDVVSTIGVVDSAGKFRNNTNDLQDLFADNKTHFLEQYRYTICPENSNYPGYVTEKIFDAIRSGCIPIYNGSDNMPEPDIINRNAVLFWEKDSDNTQLLETLTHLEHNHNDYLDFTSLPRLSPQAADIIWGYYLRLIQHLSPMLT